MVVNLNELLERYRGVRGVSRVMLLSNIRAYVSKRSVRSLLDEINAVNNISDLNVLLGAGMRGVLFTAVVGRKAQLTEF